MPSLVREVKREEDVGAGRPNWNRCGQSNRTTLAMVPRNYFAEGGADLDWSAFAAGFWLSMGTSNDRPNISL